MKKFALFTLAAAVLLLSNCTRENPGIDPNASQEVIFTSAQAGSSLKFDLPECSDLTADYALVTLNGDTYYPAVFIVNDVMYTQAIKLPPGNYELQEFILFNDNGTANDISDDIIINAAPHADAPFGEIVLKPLNFNFDVAPFTKTEIEVEVICYQEALHEEFGFVWFRVDEKRMKEILFFGDICDEYFIDFMGTLYGDYPKVDMPAIFKVELYRDEDLDGVYETLIGEYDNIDEYHAATATEDASVPPLKIAYIDRAGIEDRYQIVVYVYKIIGLDTQTMEPVFGFEYFDTWYFSDDGALLFDGVDYLTNPADAVVYEDGEDGIYDFVIGFCTGVNNDFPPPIGCETAFAYGGEGIATCFLELGLHRWGWTNYLAEDAAPVVEMPIYAGAGQCDLTKGTLVGTLIVTNNGDNSLTITYQMTPGSTFTLKETHLYVGSAILPEKHDVYTVAPGQYPWINEGLMGSVSDSYTVPLPAGGVYIVAHSVVCSL